MTHDELLKQFDIQNLTMDGGYYIAKALRAVVELHKPTPEPVFVSELECKICDSSYPCFTIQAIEEQLK